MKEDDLINHQQPKLSPEDREKLKDEAKQFYQLAKDYRQERYMKEEKFAFILDKQFLTRWKEYVNYFEVKRQQQFSLYSHHFSKKKADTEDQAKHPGFIDNQRLLVPMDQFYNDGNAESYENIVIRNDIDQKCDYRLVNEQIWNFFHKRYGGGPKIIRNAIEEKTKYNYTKKIIEVFYRKFNIVFLRKRSLLTEDYINQIEEKPIYISRVKALPDLKEKIANVLPNYLNFQLDKDKFRLWKIDCKLEDLKKFLLENFNEITRTNKKFELNELSYLEYLPKCSLEELDTFDNDICLIEEMDEDWMIEYKKIEMKNGSCEWCRNQKMLRYSCVCKEVWYCTELCKERDVRFHEDRCKKRFEIEEVSIKKSDKSRLGLVGLCNLGNTCFMNTALQCISNCFELTSFFLEGHYKTQLNVDNPIGSQGVLAKSYANLLSNLWYGTNDVFSPTKFKRAIECFQSMFTGYQQHDTHEFLNYLLDGLHEDLNKVLKKPLVEKIESNEADEPKSRKSWIGFLRRNQSILVELLYGQYKSTLYCPDEKCANVSTTFDPFLSVSLPLASKTRPYTVICYFIFYNAGKKAIKLEIPFTSECSIMALRNKISMIMNIHPFSFVIGKVESTSGFENFMSSSSLLRAGSIYREPQRFFLIQLNPELFYSDQNSFYRLDQTFSIRNYENINEEIKKNPVQERLFSEEYEENESGQTSEKLCYYSKYSFNNRQNEIKINNDNNYGFENHLHTLLFLKRYEDHTNDPSMRAKIIFPRVITVDKDWSLKTLHYQVFKFLHPVLLRYEEKENKQKFSELVKKTVEELFTYYFAKIKEPSSFEKDSVDFQKKLGFPYRLRLKNYNGYHDRCNYCEKNNCEDCFVPFSDNVSVRDLLAKIPQNDGMVIDNSFLFLRENQRFYTVKNRDFSLEVTFLPQFQDSVKNLNEYDDLSFNVSKSQTKAKSISINDSFKNFVKPEILKEDNEWYCPQCKHHQKAKKKMEIYKAPNILIIQLKRFSANSKIDTLVDFPIENLDLRDVVINKSGEETLLYDLFAISNHYGGLGGGHYTAYAMNYLTKDWWEFNDSAVHRVSKESLVSSSAYVLFYRRKNLNQIVNLQSLYVKPFENYENQVEDNSSSAKMSLD